MDFREANPLAPAPFVAQCVVTLGDGDGITTVVTGEDGKLLEKGSVIVTNRDGDGIATVVTVEDGKLLEKGRVIGKVIDASTAQGQDEGLAAVGSVEWILAESSDENWKMIPAENLIAAAKSGGTKIAFCVHREEDIIGLSRALELGVDALCVKADASTQFFDKAVAAKEERAETEASSPQDKPQEPQILTGSCYRLPKKTVLGDRVCVDLVQSLKAEEGCWIGSSAKLTAFVLSEAAISSLVPSRPFRVNAGPVHSYIVMGDCKTTKYLCELEAGDEVSVYNSITGKSKAVAVGRLKVEVRPCLIVGLETPDGAVSQLFLQQAETVRLGNTEGAFIRVTDLTSEQKATLLLRSTSAGTHIGQAYTGKVIEK